MKKVCFCNDSKPVLHHSNNQFKHAHLSSTALEQNVKLEKEHERLSAKLATSDDHMLRTSKLNVQYKHELDKLNVDRDQQQKVQHQLKAKLNE